MRAFLIGTLSTVAFARRGMGRMGGKWWGGAPECAHSCLSSVYSAEETLTEWPEPGYFCTASADAPLETCLSESCTGTMTAYSSFSSLHSSLCSVYESCTSDDDAVFTLTRPTGTGRYGGTYGPWATYTGDGTITVTGCPTGGYGMGMGGRHGWMPWGADNPDDAFWGWGYGWSSLTTVTTTVTSAESVVVETYAQAVSDGTTMTSTLAAAEAASTDSSEGDGSAGNANEVTIVGAALAAVLAVAGAL